MQAEGEVHRGRCHHNAWKCEVMAWMQGASHSPPHFAIVRSAVLADPARQCCHHWSVPAHTVPL